jgi:hypothetical protein
MYIRKPRSADLRIQDFLSHPIWGFVEEDEDEVETVVYSDNLVLPIGGGVLFVFCEYQFNDATILKGVVFVRLSDQSPYILAFPRPDGSLFDFPVNSSLAGMVTPEQLASHLEKTVDEIFPIKYETPFVFENGKKLTGEYPYPHHLTRKRTSGQK